jgi:hypothetical protein
LIQLSNVRHAVLGEGAWREQRTGVGSPGHVGGILLKNATGIRFQHVWGAARLIETPG